MAVTLTPFAVTHEYIRQRLTNGPDAESPGELAGPWVTLASTANACVQMLQNTSGAETTVQIEGTHPELSVPRGDTLFTWATQETVTDVVTSRRVVFRVPFAGVQFLTPPERAAVAIGSFSTGALSSEAYDVAVDDAIILFAGYQGICNLSGDTTVTVNQAGITSLVGIPESESATGVARDGGVSSVGAGLGGVVESFDSSVATSGLSASRSGGSCALALQNTNASAFLVLPTVPLSFLLNAADRLRSSVSETTGSLLDAVDVRAVDASVSEAYTYAQALEPAELVAFRELTRERDSAVADLAYYPRPKQSLAMENVYDGVTVLSRLARYYPPREFDTVDASGLDIVVSGGATAQQVLTYLLTKWAGLVGWLTFEPVPDLRLPLPGLTPSDYETDVDVPRTGVVRTEALAIAQDGNNRRSALDILKDFLSPFPGTILRQNSAGNLEIVPIYGPDADEDPHKVLTDWDAYAVSVGRPDPFSIVNRAIVTNSGYERQADTAIMQPAWFQVGGIVQYGRDNWFEPPNDRVNLQPYDGTNALQTILIASDGFNFQTPQLWPASSSVIAAGAGVKLTDSDDAPLVTHSWARYFNNSLVDSGTEAANLTIVTPVIPFSGVRVEAFRFARSIGGEPVHVTVFGRWNESRQGVEFTFGDYNLETDRTTGTNGVIIGFTLNDASTAFVETGGRTGTFGFVDDPADPGDIKPGDDALPGPEGINAVAASQDAYGIIEAQLNLRGYSLSVTTLAEVARAYVLANITPRVTREVELSVPGSAYLVFDDMARLVELPNGDVGYVTGRAYSDDFTGLSWRASATVEVRDLAAAGAIDTSTTYLLMDDGSYWQSDDNTFSEVF